MPNITFAQRNALWDDPAWLQYELDLRLHAWLQASDQAIAIAGRLAKAFAQIGVSAKQAAEGMKTMATAMKPLNNA